MQCFRDKVAIVTGGASGIGRGICEALGRYGASTIVADMDFEKAQEVAAIISQSGGRASPARVDVTDDAQIRNLIDQTAAEHGRLDYLFNNAGIDIGGEARDFLPDHWARVLQVNLMGVLYGTRAAYALMVRQGQGHIVNTASLCGIMPIPLQVPYVTTKYAVVGLSTTLRAEAAGLGVKVSVFCPGLVRTPLLEKSMVVNSTMNEILSISPLKAMDVHDAVQVLLRGVERNQAIIVCPRDARVAWWLYRLSPALMDRLLQKSVAQFRQKHRRTG